MGGVCTGLNLGLALEVAREFNYDVALVADLLADAEGTIVAKINEKDDG